MLLFSDVLTAEISLNCEFVPADPDYVQCIEQTKTNPASC